MINMYRLRFIVAVVLALAVMTGCGNGSSSQQEEGGTAAMQLMINGVGVAVEWEDNDSVKALQGLLPLTVEMHRYGGFEQVGGLGQALPRNDKRITTKAGDIVLYSGNQIVIFYGSNTWAYTKLGRITDKTSSQLADLLGDSDATITIE